MVWFLLVAAAATLLLAVRVWWVWCSIQLHRRGASATSKNNGKPRSTLVVWGSGGHTTEMRQCLDSPLLQPPHYQPLCFVVADTDTSTAPRLANKRGTGLLSATPQWHTIPRSREVGQSYGTSWGTTLYSLMVCCRLVWFQIRPDVVLCNGPGTCLPIVVATLAGRLLGICSGHVIFIESFCRVETLSLTGRLLYHVVDRFYVHWEELQRQYPKTELISTFVSSTRKDCH